MLKWAMKTTKTIPTFKDKNEEREFWENNDTLDYFDDSKVNIIHFPNLKKTIEKFDDYEMLDDYDFSDGVRGRFFNRPK